MATDIQVSTADISGKARYGGAVFGAKIPKFALLFMGVNMTQTFLKKKGFSELSSTAISILAGVAIATAVKI